MSQIGRVIPEIDRVLSTTSATDNPAPQADVDPDQVAPILRNGWDGSVELMMAR